MDPVQDIINRALSEEVERLDAAVEYPCVGPRPVWSAAEVNELLRREREKVAVMAERLAKEWAEKYPAEASGEGRAFDGGYCAGCAAVAREVRNG